nr:Elongation factor Tu GTP binding domain [uncultured bacterium]
MKIINIGILAHVDAGKTTLTESLLYASGAISEPGSVEKGDNEDGHHVFGAAAWDYHSSGSHFLPVAQM